MGIKNQMISTLSKQLHIYGTVVSGLGSGCKQITIASQDRYLVIIPCLRRNTARQLSSELATAIAVVVSRQNVSRRLNANAFMPESQKHVFHCF